MCWSSLSPLSPPALPQEVTWLSSLDVLERENSSPLVSDMTAGSCSPPFSLLLKT